MLQTLDPAALDLPDALVDQLTPPLGTFGALSGSGEQFSGATGALFDVLGAADSAADLTFGALLHPDRAARLVEMARRDNGRLGFDEMLQEIERVVFASQSNDRLQAIARRIQTRYVSYLISLSAGQPASGEVQAAARGLGNGGGAIAAPDVQTIADAHLKQLRTRLAPGLLSGQSADRLHREWLIDNIERHLGRPAPANFAQSPAPDIPPGSPIGAGFMEPCWHCEAE